MRTLEEILADLNAAEKEYSEKCKKYGIEEKRKKKKEDEKQTENPDVNNSQEIDDLQAEQVSGGKSTGEMDEQILNATSENNG